MPLPLPSSLSQQAACAKYQYSLSKQQIQILIPPENKLEVHHLTSNWPIVGPPSIESMCFHRVFGVLLCYMSACIHVRAMGMAVWVCGSGITTRTNVPLSSLSQYWLSNAVLYSSLLLLLVSPVCSVCIWVIFLLFPYLPLSTLGDELGFPMTKA